MPIPETQLDTWSRQGSVTQSKQTCDTVRGVLERSDAPYAGRSYGTFLQGSYANDTNIYADSDVDIVIRLDSTYYHSTEDLNEADKAAFGRAVASASYDYSQFKADVAAHLTRHYGSAVRPGKKAIFIAGNANRRDADVLPAALFRRYTRFRSSSDQSYVEGICFWADGVRIVNYPRQHSANCTSKHQAANGWFKPTVRIFKNMRNRMVADGLIGAGLAPSYFIEGMVYNVPNSAFGTSYADTVVAVLNWLQKCERDKLVCANEQFYLLHATSPVTWRKESFEAFLAAAIGYWNRWT